VATESETSYKATLQNEADFVSKRSRLGVRRVRWNAEIVHLAVIERANNELAMREPFGCSVK